MELWVLFTLIGVLIQSTRTVLQKRLIGRLSVAGSTYARFLYGAPVAWLMVAGIAIAAGEALPQPGWMFFVYALAGGLTQILGNAVFIHLIGSSNFAVITTYIKTETVIGALFSFMVLGDRLSPMGLTGVLVTVLGVAVLSTAKTEGGLRRVLGARDMLYGVGVGALYAVASTSYRGAILSLEAPNLALAALFTLACVSLMQSVGMGLYLRILQPEVLRETFKAWRSAGWVGITGAGASAAWYMAFSLQVTAYVLAVGQVEVLIAYLSSHFLFKERTKGGEIAGILVTLAGIITVVLSR
jgi:drug/metabolite transporter (DMT)-like permease